MERWCGEEAACRGVPLLQRRLSGRLERRLALLGGLARRLLSLDGLQVVRTWGGLRIMAPDAFPIYDRSEKFPGAYAATCHSGVTLAAAHALELGPAILEDNVPPELASFTAKRFGARVANDDWVASRAP